MSSIPTVPKVKPRLQLFSDWLLEPDVPMRWLIDGWMNDGSRILTFAAYKAGKTTLISNLLRSMADGDLFLGEVAVAPLKGDETIVLLDFEMSAQQLKEWTLVQGIQHTTRVVVKPLRGVAGSFDITKSTCRSEWAADLRSVNCKFLVIDCIGPVMSALDLDESSNTQVARFLRLIDELLMEAGVENCWLVHHMGHDEKKPRGASAVLGWCDVTITLARKGDPSTGQRSIEAAGRGVSQQRRDLLYDETTHRFTLMPVGKFSFPVGAGAAPKQNAVDRALREIVLVLQPPSPPQGVKALTALLHSRGFSWHANTVRDAVRLGVQTGELKQGGLHNSPTYSVP